MERTHSQGSAAAFRVCAVAVLCGIATPSLAASDLNLRGNIFADADFVDRADVPQDVPYLRDTEMRRAEFILDGSLRVGIDYKLQVDLAVDHPAYKDMYLQFDAGPLVVTAGQMKPVPVLTNVTAALMMEQADVEKALGTTDRQTGIMLSAARRRWGTTVGTFSGAIVGDSQTRGATLATRWYFNPMLSEDAMLHLGGAVRVRRHDTRSSLLRYDAGAVLHMDAKSIRSGAVGDRDTLVEIEVAGILDAGSMESQCMLGRITTPNGADRSNSITGCYITLAWFLTGQHCGYDKGRFREVEVDDSVVDGGPGAWQITSRYDTIDFGELGGDAAQHNWSLGLNWYMTDHFRFAANYVRGRFAAGAKGGSIDGWGLRCVVE